MGKKRKTYKEKLISDLRRKTYNLGGLKASSLEQPSSSASASFVLQNPASLGQKSHPYLLKDISKTGILTASVIAIQLILFFILRNKILSIPGVSY